MLQHLYGKRRFEIFEIGEKYMTITVIGGSGFVGTRLVKRLVASGHTVKIADKRKSVTF